MIESKILANLQKERISPAHYRYLLEIGLLLDGNTRIEPEARQLAKEYNLPLQLLEEALPIGCVNQINRYLGYVREGMTYYDAEIQEIMGKYGSILPNQQKQSIYLRLDSALEVGREKEYDKFVSYVEEGILKSEPLARQIAQEYGFSTEKLDQAINRESERFDRIESKTQIPAEESMPTIPAHLLEDMVKNIPQLENRE